MSSTFRIQGIELCCHHCGSKSFTRLGARIGDVDHDLIDTVFGLPDLRSASAFTCHLCGHVHWFVLNSQIEELPDEIACIECNAIIPGSESACPSCGWSWESSPR